MGRYAGKGFTLVEVIISVGIMLVVFTALFGALRASLAVSTLAKSKATATETASTQMEYLRGIAYDSLGTAGGIPAGIVPQTSTTTVDGISFVIHTYIEYYDDPADGLDVNDVNHVTTDYKKGKVRVSYVLHGLTNEVSLVSNFVPPSIESTTGGGTLSLHVVNALGANVNDATVQIINTATSPTINFITSSDTNGLVTIGGAATSSQYQIYVSNTGYSSAQTYARAGQNVNPTPGYLTVAKDQTTTATFAIDTLANLTLRSLSPASTTLFSDLFITATNLTSQTNTQVSGGALILTNGSLSGSARSTTVAPSYLQGWGILSATLDTPSDTTAVVHVDDASGTPIPDSVLPGNSAGFSVFPVSLTGVSTSSYPSLSLEAGFTRTAATATSSIFDWSLSHTDGPAPLPNSSYTLTGAKTVGTDAGGLSIFKTTVTGSTGASASKTESLEWDAYSLAVTGANLIESCPAVPYSLTPGQATSTTLMLGTLTTHTLPINIENTAGNDISYAKIVLTKSGYAATELTSACGFAFFNGLSSGTYSANVSAAGYTTTTFPNLVVSGHTATTTLVLP